MPKCPDIYVIGDLPAAVDANGKPLPGLAQVAMQGAIYVAKTILREVKGQPELTPFRYFDKGSLAVIGRSAAVATHQKIKSKIFATAYGACPATGPTTILMPSMNLVSSM
jgi:NADH dehydrogenase FAD-containing subunit